MNIIKWTVVVIVGIISATTIAGTPNEITSQLFNMSSVK